MKLKRNVALLKIWDVQLSNWIADASVTKDYSLGLHPTPSPTIGHLGLSIEVFLT
jgi:hypothetical protein